MEQAELWAKLTDFEGNPYDPRLALADLDGDDAGRAYDELWEKLHHQGDLGTAAYAAVPELAASTAPSASPKRAASRCSSSLTSGPQLEYVRVASMRLR